VITLVDEASASGARLQATCAELAVAPRTVQRWRQGGAVKADGRQQAARQREPANKLASQERERILAVINQPAFAHLSPNQIVPELADQGIYLASESSFYRVLREAGQLARRGKAKPPTHRRPTPLVADAPNQLWSWDITYLATTIKGQFFYLYLIMDVFSRKIVGWEVYDIESADYAANVFSKAHLREEVAASSLVLHSDNGSPMKGATMLATLHQLGVTPSFSRPSVSNDNPFSEALFKTLKYHPGCPDQPFASLDEARTWVARFNTWYNDSHHHSAIKFVTPSERHRGDDKAILAQRKALYEKARSNHPERWSGDTRNWQRIQSVHLNPGRPITKEDKSTSDTA
jgi:transposase InsO family protein